jgi:hypothetical protein
MRISIRTAFLLSVFLVACGPVTREALTPTLGDRSTPRSTRLPEPQLISIAAYACGPHGYYGEGVACAVLSPLGTIIDFFYFYGGGLRQSEIVTGPSGYIFAVTNSRYDPDLCASKFGPGGSGPLGEWLHNNNGCYVIAISPSTKRFAIGGGDDIFVYNDTDTGTFPIDTLTARFAIIQLAFDTAGDCFDSEGDSSNSEYVGEFTKCKGPERSTGISLSARIFGMAFDGANNLYYSSGSSLYKCAGIKKCRAIVTLKHDPVGDIAFDEKFSTLFFVGGYDVYKYSVATGKHSLFSRSPGFLPYTSVASSNGPNY